MNELTPHPHPLSPAPRTHTPLPVRLIPKRHLTPISILRTSSNSTRIPRHSTTPPHSITPNPCIHNSPQASSHPKTRRQVYEGRSVFDRRVMEVGCDKDEMVDLQVWVGWDGVGWKLLLLDSEGCSLYVTYRCLARSLLNSGL